MWSEIVSIYRASKKKKDINWFTEHIARPPAAVLLYFLRRTPITPNQVTFLATFVAVGAGAMFALLPGHLWLILAALVFELSFVLDCVDGQLARLKKIASPLGHLLDFLMDELKAMLIYGCITVRLWQQTDEVYVLLVGLGGMFCLASGISLTSFMRRPEYGAKPITEEGQPADVGKRRGPVGLVLNGLEAAARVVVHYPSYIWLCAAVDRIDIFFWAYGAVNALYLAKSFLTILVRLGRFGAPVATFAAQAQAAAAPPPPAPPAAGGPA
ncbi:MAG: CDP-alcohol phosphatidyltransferase family protein [Kofleriaceae bacterium]|nr:CDP-alcohol phosphatidyltransferase family protein [Kofleriaceae bacterium]MCB9572395.1 CDP-alcohol phosphatidyltransferase family protein [Kofleriaceae bacterium]